MSQESSSSIARWRGLRLRAFTWRAALPARGKVGLAFAMAGVTALAAQVRVPLPWTPVPVTGQVFAVLLAGVLLGRGYGALSQGIYVGLGAAGLPVFAGLSGGAAALIGPSGGYIIGFVAAAELLAFFTDRRPACRRFLPLLALMGAAVAVIYAFGAVQFALVTGLGLGKVLAGAVLPFIPFDLAKAVLAAGIAVSLLPKVPFGGEADVRP